MPGSSFNIILRKYRCQDVLNTSIRDSLLGLGQEGFGPYSDTIHCRKKKEKKKSRASICVPHHFISPFHHHVFQAGA